MKANTFKNTAELNYSKKDVFKLFNKMAKQDFPRFNPKEAIGTSTTKTIGAYANRQASAYVEITDYKEDEVYEVTTIASKSNVTFMSRYELEEIDENTTRLILSQSQTGTGFFDTLNHFIHTLFYKNRIEKRFELLVSSLEYQLDEMLEKRNPKPKKEIEEIAADSDNSVVAD